MSLREVFRLEESTTRQARGVYNLLVKTVIYSVAIVALIGIGVVLNFVIVHGSALIGLDDKTQNLLSTGSKVLYVLYVVLAFILGVGDQLRLMRHYISGEESRNDRE